MRQRIAAAGCRLVLAAAILHGVPLQSSAQVPLVYDAENTGKNFAHPVLRDASAAPGERTLPDPFLWFDGTGRDFSFKAWEHHRNDHMFSIQRNEIGPKPDCADCTIDAVWQPPAESASAEEKTGYRRGRLDVTVTRRGKTLTLHSQVWLPASGKGPFPFVIGIARTERNEPQTGSLPNTLFTSRNIATVTFFHDDVTRYVGGHRTTHASDPFYLLYPEFCAGECPSGTSNAGQYAAWSWGVSRLLDGIRIAATGIHPAAAAAAPNASAHRDLLPLDLHHSAITGCSYAGKMALFAGAQDERIALTLSQENGGGGAPSWRYNHFAEPQGKVEDIDNTDFEWFAGQMHQFAGDNAAKEPTDHHELLSMVAPRALFETGNTDSMWLGNHANLVSAVAARSVYSTLGIGDRFGFFIDGGHPHCRVPDAQIPALSAFVDKFLLGKNVDTNVAVYPQTSDFTSIDYAAWMPWSAPPARPSAKPSLPAPR